jgi:hypothetical protein
MSQTRPDDSEDESWDNEEDLEAQAAAKAGLKDQLSSADPLEDEDQLSSADLGEDEEPDESWDDDDALEAQVGAKAGLRAQLGGDDTEEEQDMLEEKAPSQPKPKAKLTQQDAVNAYFQQIYLTFQGVDKKVLAEMMVPNPDFTNPEFKDKNPPAMIFSPLLPDVLIAAAYNTGNQKSIDDAMKLLTTKGYEAPTPASYQKAFDDVTKKYNTLQKENYTITPDLYISLAEKTGNSETVKSARALLQSKVYQQVEASTPKVKGTIHDPSEGTQYPLNRAVSATGKYRQAVLDRQASLKEEPVANKRGLKSGGGT